MKHLLFKASTVFLFACGIATFSACHTTDNANTNSGTPQQPSYNQQMPDSAHKDKDSISDGGFHKDNGGAIDTALPTQKPPTK